MLRWAVTGLPQQTQTHSRCLSHPRPSRSRSWLVSEMDSRITQMTPRLREKSEERRVAASELLDRDRRRELGQYFTPAGLAEMLASFFDLASLDEPIRLLDPGAGTGSLTAAFVARCAILRPDLPIEAHAFEVDQSLLDPLSHTLRECEALHPKLVTQVHVEDFISWGAEHVLLGEGLTQFDCVIMNPPYRKIHSASRERRALRSAHIESTNLYTGFLALTVRMLSEHGQLVAITPRSFFNGRYFRDFRKDLLARTSLRRIHVFESRSAAFKDDDVLQENVVFQLTRGRTASDVVVSTSSGPEGAITEHRLRYEDVVHPHDTETFIRIAPTEMDQVVAKRTHALRGSLSANGFEVSTGRVVDFRTRPNLRRAPSPGCAPLIYPGHLAGGWVRWPEGAAKKPKALEINEHTRGLLLPAGHYVLVKRFSSKEEPRRVVAAVYDPGTVRADVVAFENHLNVFHVSNEGMPRPRALGLAAFLNSTVVDAYFRFFNGHTQVNATDLRNMRYPTVHQLDALGEACETASLEPGTVDELVERYVPELALDP